NKGQSRLAELELDWINAEDTRRRAQRERRLKIRQLETKLALDRDKMERTSRVVSHARGRVAQVLTARNELVREGAPVVLLHAPQTERGADIPGPPCESIIFVPAGEGKRINPGDAVEVVPATVKREEDGFIRGQVVVIGKLPATKQTLEEALGHPELADVFLKRYAPGGLLRVQVKLAYESRPFRTNPSRSDVKNPFLWSSIYGQSQTLKT